MAAICHNFKQNAWKKDLCSNCFKSKQDHDPKLQSLNNNNNNNTLLHNNNHAPNLKMESLSGRYISQTTTIYQSNHSARTTWRGIALNNKNAFNSSLSNSSEIGSKPVYGTISYTPVQNGGTNTKEYDNAWKSTSTVPGILKCGPCSKTTPNGKYERRSSVGFKEEAPQVIGYGGDVDYESDGEERYEEEESDGGDEYDDEYLLDLTDEERAMMKLTERNTEFNSFNKNLLTEAPTAKKEETVVYAAKTTVIESSTVPAPVKSGPAMPLNHFTVNTHVYSLSHKHNGVIPNGTAVKTSEDLEDPLQQKFLLPRASIKPLSNRDAPTKLSAVVTPTVHESDGQNANGSEDSNTVEENKQNNKVSRVFHETLNNLITKRESPTSVKADISPTSRQRVAKAAAAVAETKCIPYEVSPVSKVTPKPPPTSTDVAPKLPSVPPPDLNDESLKAPATQKGFFKSLMHLGVKTSPKPDDPASTLRADKNIPSPKQEPTFGSFGKAPSPMSEHTKDTMTPISSSAVSTKPPMHYSSSSILKGLPASTAALPTPYSSTSVLTGIPASPTSQQKPTVSKPKPKIPAKPTKSSSGRDSSDDASSKSPDSLTVQPSDSPQVSTSESKTDSSPSVSFSPEPSSDAEPTIDPNIYHEIEEETEAVENYPSPSSNRSSPDKSELSFEAKVANLANALDFSRRNPKRQAPQPPVASTPEIEEPPTVFPKQTLYQVNSAPTTPTATTPTTEHAFVAPSESVPPTPCCVPVAPMISPVLPRRTVASPTTSKRNFFNPAAMKGRLAAGENYVTQKLFGDDRGKSKTKFSLKKLLKFGRDTEDDDHHHHHPRSRGPYPAVHEKRCRLEIIHPMDLMGQADTEDGDEDQHRGHVNDPAETHLRSGTSYETINAGSVTDLTPTGSETRYLEAIADGKGAESPSVNSSASTPSVDGSNRHRPPPPPRARGPGDRDLRPSRPPPPLPTDAGCPSDSPESRPDIPRRSGKAAPAGGEYANLGDMRNGLTPKKPERGSPVDSREATEKPTQIFIIHGAKKEKEKIDTTYEAVEAPYDDVTEMFSDGKYYEPSDVLQASSFSTDTEGTIQFIDQTDNDDSSKDSPSESRSQEVQRTDASPVPTPASPGKVPRNLRQMRAQGMLFGETDEPNNAPLPESTVPATPAAEVTVNGCSHEVPNVPTAAAAASVPTPPVYSEVRKPKASASSPQLTTKTCDAETKSLSEGGATPSDNAVVSPLHLKDADLSLTSSVSPSEDSNVSSSGIEEDAGSLSSSAPSLPRWWNSRLSLRKNRTVVHKSLEDNYGAVVTANHEALSQILEQISQSKTNHPVHPLKDAILRWSDFSVIEKAVTVIGSKAFCNAVWTSNTSEEFTLMVSKDAIPTAYSGKGPFILPPLVAFHDLIPSQLLESNASGRLELTQTQISSLSDPSGSSLRGHVWVFPRMQVTQMEDFAEELQHTLQNDIESFERSICFILLQLINGLKHLQAEGVEEVDSALEWMVLVRDKKDVNYRVTLVGIGTPAFSPQQSSMVSLCECSLLVMRMLFSKKDVSKDTAELNIPDSLPSKHAFQVVADIFQKEKATSLSKAKAILEYMLWGPVELSVDTSHSHEMALQRWLDLERATVLNNLIRSQGLWQIELTVLEEYHLLFLVRTTSRMLREAAAMIATESTNV